MRTVDWFFWFEVDGQLKEFNRGDPIQNFPEDGFILGLFLHSDGTARNISGNLVYYVWMHDSDEIAVGQSLPHTCSQAEVELEIAMQRRRYPKAHFMRGKDVPDGMMAAAQDRANQRNKEHRERCLGN